jgi:dihydroflavonol-4-reductase
MKALVTGANGLIGANVVRALVRGGHHVRAFVRATSDCRSLDGLPVEIHCGDVLDLESLCSAARDRDVLFHAAALFSYEATHTAELEHLAVDGTINAIHAAHAAKVRRVVLTSSSVVFGSSNRPLIRNEQDQPDERDPVPYILAKEAQERVAFEHAERLGVKLVAVCPTLTVGAFGHKLGPSNGAIVAYLSDPSKATFPGGCNIVSVSDVAQGHVLVAQKGKPGEKYLLGSENIRWSSIHRTISELCGIPGPSWQANHTTSMLVAAASELVCSVTRTPPLTTRAQARMVGRYYWYEHKKVEALGYRPRPARTALAEAIAWLSASSQITRAIRTTLRLSREVFEAKQALDLDEAALRVMRVKR